MTQVCRPMWVNEMSMVKEISFISFSSVQKKKFWAPFDQRVRPSTLPELANMSGQIFGRVITV